MKTNLISSSMHRWKTTSTNNFQQFKIINFGHRHGDLLKFLNSSKTFTRNFFCLWNFDVLRLGRQMQLMSFDNFKFVWTFDTVHHNGPFTITLRNRFVQCDGHYKIQTVADILDEIIPFINRKRYQTMCHVIRRFFFLLFFFIEFIIIDMSVYH